MSLSCLIINFICSTTYGLLCHIFHRFLSDGHIQYTQLQINETETTFSRTIAINSLLKQCPSGLKRNRQMLCNDQSLDLNPTETLVKLKDPCTQAAPIQQKKLEQFCHKKWGKKSETRCAKLVETYPK